MWSYLPTLAELVDLDVLAQPLGFVPDLLAGILGVFARPRMPDLGVDVLVSAPVTGRLLKLVRNRLIVGRHVLDLRAVNVPCQRRWYVPAASEAGEGRLSARLSLIG